MWALGLGQQPQLLEKLEKTKAELQEADQKVHHLVVSRVPSGLWAHTHCSVACFHHRHCTALGGRVLQALPILLLAWLPSPVPFQSFLSEVRLQYTVRRMEELEHKIKTLNDGTLRPSPKPAATAMGPVAGPPDLEVGSFTSEAWCGLCRSRAGPRGQPRGIWPDRCCPRPATRHTASDAGASIHSRPLAGGATGTLWCTPRGSLGPPSSRLTCSGARGSHSATMCAAAACATVRCFPHLVFHLSIRDSCRTLTTFFPR